MKKAVVTILLPFFVYSFLQAATVDTIITQSAVMNKKIKAVVVLPDSYNGKNTYPVVYTLHGYSDNFRAWIKKSPIYKSLADTYQVILVSPDGKNSWYWDSPINPDSQYETYIAKELVSHIDQRYQTVKSPQGRAITGLSMGGHGALYLAIKHQNVFGIAGSMSGGVDIRPFPNNWKMKNQLGTYAQNKQRWETNTVINMVEQIKPDSLKLIIDCGIDDFFYGVNVDLHNKLLKNKIPHDFISRQIGRASCRERV